MSSEVCDRSAAVNLARQYMTYMSMYHAGSSFPSSAYYRHTETRRNGLCTTFKVRSSQKVFVSLPDSVVTTEDIIKPEPPTEIVVEF